ncbi:ABC transporter permease [Lichenihabitans sp. PAMC28606]|uniref:ABC transporter permease n=1 Tax=Lichenihabitans sp. PAMC28606 TaxID=2880932 RepID=UPI001D0A2972|nr:ABC transporter permease [Lichenihabitans sp. PAMC28606]UDL96761.1 ABC transporter permease [Lichenihabitans sp. PAMC28606]
MSLKTILAQPWLWSFVGAVAVWIAAILYTGGYGAGGMVSAGIALAAFSVIVGTAQMFVVTLGPGNVDLSLPANIGLASAVAMKVMGGSDDRIVLGLAAAIAAGMAIGGANYLLIRLLRIPPIIATLSASFVIQSIGISYGRGLQVKPPPGFADAMSAAVGGVSLVAIGAVLFSLVIAVLLHRTVFGRSVAAIGQNARAARLANLLVERIRLLTYTLSGGLGGLSGALLAGYFRGSSLDIGNEYLLMSIAVVVIGGTSVAGGKANVTGLWGASLFLVMLLTMLNTYGVSAGLRLLVTGLVIIGVIVVAGGRRTAR